jgi:hypothetical protein
LSTKTNFFRTLTLPDSITKNLRKANASLSGTERETIPQIRKTLPAKSQKLIKIQEIKRIDLKIETGSGDGEVSQKMVKTKS